MDLPDSRAFLIRLNSSMNLTSWSSGEPMGRIEHVETGLRAPISCLEDIRRFIAKVVAQEAVVVGEEEFP